VNVKHGIISAAVGASLLGGVGVGAVVSGGGATTLVSAPAAATLTATTPAAPVATTTGPAATTARTAAPAAPGDCSVRDDGEWPDSAASRPARLDAGDTGGVYLWHDDAGWHLRVTHKPGDKRVYKGVLTTSGRFADADAVALERNDQLRVGPSAHVLSFRFVNYGHIDGVDFHTECAPRMTFSLEADGHQLGTERVLVGHSSTNPTSVPFTVEQAH